MADKKLLKAVDGASVPDGLREAPKTIYEAAESGSQLDQLIALRRRIAATLDADTTLARDLASLSKRMMEVSKEIEQLQAQEAERAKDAEVKDGNISTIWNSEAI
ncbi:hypothetical protein [Auritidibacter ignavus]|uniref:Terminase small subunit n=1 Tax=Auritidibacter ignavus TaxID=678932 RepID=A0AAJ6AIL3_9MICC|nr:hypothetical protein [Auritidibacter ignavus]NIH72226.1 putative RNase H-like nuclease (RuvC/YqgF family) [Auritidibacter ignavus]WGH91712.1 hypothetical protein QDX23_04960 [Auritidibacter ignavus]WGH94158.1 hypothetical protein QDX21_05030 [Auritidibacter ignavus]WHS27548.1 hypothetical protein QM395_09215 [Auritidibacter ignavus]